MQASTVEQLKAEVSALQAEKVELDSQQRRLDKEMETLNTHTSARTQLDMLKKEKVSDEDPLFLVNVERLIHHSRPPPPGGQGGPGAQDQVSAQRGPALAAGPLSQQEGAGGLDLRQVQGGERHQGQTRQDQVSLAQNSSCLLSHPHDTGTYDT